MNNPLYYFKIHQSETRKQLENNEINWPTVSGCARIKIKCGACGAHAHTGKADSATLSGRGCFRGFHPYTLPLSAVRAGDHFYANLK